MKRYRHISGGNGWCRVVLSACLIFHVVALIAKELCLMTPHFDFPEGARRVYVGVSECVLFLYHLLLCIDVCDIRYLRNKVKEKWKDGMNHEDVLKISTERNTQPSRYHIV